MGRYSLVTAALIVAAVLTVPVGADEDKPLRAGTSAKAPADPAETLHERLVTDLKLTASREKTVREALAAYRRDLAAWSRKNDPEIARLRKRMGKYHAMRDPKTMADIKVAMGGLKKLRAEEKGLKESLLAKLKTLLTDEQFARALAALNPRPKAAASTNKFHHLGKLGLSEAQLLKIKAVMLEANKKLSMAGKTKSAVGPMQEAWVRIVKEVLTDKDREKLGDMIRMASHRRMVMAMFESVQLTTKQAAKIDEIWEKAYAKATKDAKNRFQIYGEAQRQAVEEVLTDEQRKQLTSGPKKPAGHPRGMPGGRPGGMMPMPR